MPNLTIGERLKTIRQSRSLSLEDTSRLTDVSKPMLGQLERGQSSPTVNTLWKIASGLKVPLSVFLQETEADYTVINMEEQNSISESNGLMRAYTLFPFDPVRGFEAFYIIFDHGCEHHSEKHQQGVEESIFVFQGQLDLILNGEKVVLKEKQSLRFRADIPHSYRNPYQDTCMIHEIIFYHSI